MANFIEFPVFDGVSGDLRQWIAWLEDFFVRERFTEDEKMNLAQSLLEGEANAWFYSSRKRFAFQSWEHLVVDLLLWRFGDFGDFGVFSDPELFLLWDKYDQIFQAQRVEKKRKRMSRTAITPQESISSSATIPETITVDKFSNQQVDEISAEKKESKQEVDLSMEKIASQLNLPNTTVHVSDSENLRNIETRIENSVLDNFESVVKEAKIQKDIRMDVVNDSKNVSAHQVLDKMCQLKRLKQKNKRKLHLSLKTWKFKFKTKNLQHNWSQRDLLQVIDRSKINNLYLCFGANFGLVRNKITFQCLRLQKQAHKSRVLYQLRMLHDPGGKKDEHFAEIFETEVDIGKVQRTQMDIVAESVITAPDNVAHSTDVIPNRQNWNAACDAAIDALDGTATWIVISLPANNIEEAVEIAQVTLSLQFILDDLKSYMRYKWKSKHLRAVFDFQSNLSSALVVVNKPVTECQNTDAIFQLVLERTVSHEWHRWKHKTAYLQGLLEFVVFALVKLQDIDKEMGADPVTQAHKFTVDKFGRLHTTRLTVLRVLCLLGTLLWSTSFKKQKFGKNWWYKFKHSIWQRECSRETSWMFFKAFVHLYLSYKLEDKLGLQGVSIDTFQSHCGKKWELPAQ